MSETQLPGWRILIPWLVMLLLLAGLLLHLDEHRWVLVLGVGALILMGISKMVGPARAGSFKEVQEHLAEDIVDLQRKLYSQEHLYASQQHRYIPVNESAMRRLDMEFYTHVTKSMKQLQFRDLGNVIDITSNAATPWAYTVLRVFLSGDGTTVGAAYHVKLNGLYRMLQLVGVLSRHMKVIDLESELSDGTFIVTANTRECDLTLAVPGVDRRQFSWNTSTDELVSAHRQHVREVLASRPGLSLIRYNNLQEALAAQERQRILKE
jgi:hypothetical protein